MDLLDYGAFGARMRALLNTKRIPLGGTFEVTGRCPLRCGHCYNREPLTARERDEPSLSLAQQCRIVDELVDAGCLWLLFTGGEIFSRPDFMDFYLHARRRGLLITLFTSGVLITDEIADTLVRHRPLRIEITLSGSNPEVHEKVTGVAGSFERCLRGIHLLKARDLPLVLKTTVTRDNVEDLPAIQVLAEQTLGLPHRFDAMLNGRLDVAGAPLELRLREDEVVALDVGDERRRGEWVDFAARYLGAEHAGTSSGTLYGCGAGVHSFAIDPWGGLKLCTLSRQACYDLHQGSFADGWKALVNLRQQPAVEGAMCTACSLRSMCESCPAVAELEHGEARVRSEFHCSVAHGRARGLDLAVEGHGPCSHCPPDDGGVRKSRSAVA
ncbi:MAG: radical SAM protein [Pseudomonadota bacterium]